jgi:branched-chain amino acid transport system substrate-binding protein
VNDAGEVVSETVAIVSGVDQTFGGVFSETTDPPSREAPACVEADIPWIGNATPVVDGVIQG